MKPKSNIAWDNHCMRKFGKNIKLQIFNIGKDQALNMVVYKKLKEQEEIIEEVKKQAVWSVTEPGTC